MLHFRAENQFFQSPLSAVQRGLCIIVLLLIWPGAPVNGDLYSGPVELLQLETRHFLFIYPPESADAAEYLAGIADNMYEWVAENLNTDTGFRRFPVVITPDTDLLNGSFTIFPSQRIRLFQAPLSPSTGFARYNDPLGKLFLHELTHAVSLTLRSPFFSVGKFLLGDVVAPAYFTAPPFFVEGVTVAAESVDGYGRADDTPYASVIQQDILENRMMSPMESNGIRGAYPSGAWYIYGGWFSRYLIGEYGRDAYAEFWNLLGTGQLYQDGLFCDGAFSKAFGQPIQSVWQDFRSWISIKSPVFINNRVLDAEYRVIGATATYPGGILFSSSQRVYQLEWEDPDALEAALPSPESLKIKSIFPSDNLTNRIAVHGDEVLVSTYRRDSEGQFRAILKSFSLENGRPIPGPLFPGQDNLSLLEAVRDPRTGSILGIRPRGYSGDLVRVDTDGRIETLLEGTPGLIPSMPVPMGKYIYFLIQQRGENRIARRTEYGSVEVLETGIPLRGIRNISGDEESLYFIYDNDFSLFKLGVFTPGKSLRIQQESISGGVQYPVGAAGERIAYVGNFSPGQRLMLHPARLTNSSQNSSQNSHTVFQADSHMNINSTERQSSIEQLTELEYSWIALESFWDAEGSGNSTVAEQGYGGMENLFPADQSLEFSPEPYVVLPWIFTPRLRYPLLSLNPRVLNGSEDSALITGGGAGFSTEDPTSAFSLTANLQYLYDQPFLHADVQLGIFSLPVAFRLGFRDWRIYNPIIDGELQGDSRELSVSLSASQRISLYPIWRNISWELQSEFIQQFDEDPVENAGPYGWESRGWRIPILASLGYGSIRDNPLDSRGPAGFQSRLSGLGIFSESDLLPPTGYAAVHIEGDLPFMYSRLRLFSAVSVEQSTDVSPAGALIPGVSLGFDRNYSVHPGFSASAESGGKIYAFGELRMGQKIPLNTGIFSLVYLQNLKIKGGHRLSVQDNILKDEGRVNQSSFAAPSMEFVMNGGALARTAWELGAEFSYLYGNRENPWYVSVFLTPAGGF